MREWFVRLRKGPAPGTPGLTEVHTFGLSFGVDFGRLGGFWRALGSAVCRVRFGRCSSRSRDFPTKFPGIPWEIPGTRGRKTLPHCTWQRPRVRFGNAFGRFVSGMSREIPGTSPDKIGRKTLPNRTRQTAHLQRFTNSNVSRIPPRPIGGLEAPSIAKKGFTGPFEGPLIVIENQRFLFSKNAIFG